ncbi:MAG: LCP family protein [Candidatus Doudnabacteria bacterium]|nr:LCP family protein [Candidatus Doudnabacteria bacterium]
MKDIDSIHKIQPAPSQNQNYRPQAPAAKPQTVSLLKTPEKSRGKKILKRIVLLLGAVILILGVTIAVRAASLSSKIFVGQKITFFGQLANFISGGGGGEKLTGEDLGQINILLLGVGGAGHDGPYLTDTMILAQIRPDIGQITLTSIPRDYWVNMPEGGQDKINSAFAYGLGQNMDWNQAGSYARQVVQNLSGLQIPYFAVMDFSGFEKAVDQVGGVDVTVDRTFTDYQYPDSGTGYLPPQTFTAGLQHMDGARALIFARSRHAAGIEGSDFARSQRQQKIIEAFKQKVLSGNLISDTGNLNSLLGIFADHFHTNMTPADIYRLYSLSKSQNMQTLSLSLDPDTGLICPEILASNGAYVLTPCQGKSPADVQNFFKNSFSIGKLAAEKSTVWLADSTGNQQAYDTAFRELTDAGITVFQLAYSKDHLAQTIVFQANPKPATAEFIKNSLNAEEVTLPPPGVTVNKDRVDVIVVLGQNAPALPPPPLYVPPPARVAAIPTTATDTINSIASTTTATTTK